MRTAALLLCCLALAACDEPTEPTPAPEPPPAEEAPADERPAPPALDALAEPEGGEARAALPAADGTFDTPTLSALFGSDEERVLVVLAEGDTPDARKVRLTFFGALTPGAHEVVRDAARGDRTEVFTVALDHMPDLRVTEGEVRVERLEEDTLVATLDAEVRSRTYAEPLRLRARLHATRDDFYDAQLAHERAIRSQLRGR
ncbi:MAG TPA: hypothetical protein RMH85_15000 [Polyangiaceae bacterium LLY-WYZ-15_(1-7)]|nr:hypothetical protein [Sandaracinus sp.]HJK89535.1 hypothetical protein [Polyangiaceae bacterium LLY-WYZ-15_(1-7)]MBJ75316.1 hypothetical protein [Sandaracinus sp.]HJL05944.1 hypothetical protein [Polyangiaceae bacterium LLY-WYZ-15_(1-7)]HJL09805.1 hypothetical protein [Polyangiaceae bacterium LLY-WYZ-15_(1-7)]